MLKNNAFNEVSKISNYQKENEISEFHKELIKKCFEKVEYIEFPPLSQKIKNWEIARRIDNNILKTLQKFSHITITESIKDQEIDILNEGFEEKETHDILYFFISLIKNIGNLL